MTVCWPEPAASFLQLVLDCPDSRIPAAWVFSARDSHSGLWIVAAPCSHSSPMLWTGALVWNSALCGCALWGGDPLRRRALQCACRWRTGLEDLLAKAPISRACRSPRSLGCLGLLPSRCTLIHDYGQLSAGASAPCAGPKVRRIRAWRVFQ